MPGGGSKGGRQGVILRHPKPVVLMYWLEQKQGNRRWKRRAEQQPRTANAALAQVWPGAAAARMPGAKKDFDWLHSDNFI